MNKVEPMEHDENCAKKDGNYKELSNTHKEEEPEMVINDN